MNAVRLIIQGRVQGVGYRDWLVAEATRLRLAGWVRNLTDGTVEAVLAGPPDEVGRCTAACRHGPPTARVTGIIETSTIIPAESGFRRLPTAAPPN